MNQPNGVASVRDISACVFPVGFSWQRSTG